MNCPGCAASFFTNEDILCHIVRQFFRPNTGHQDLHLAIQTVMLHRDGRGFHAVSMSTVAGTVPSGAPPTGLQGPPQGNMRVIPATTGSWQRTYQPPILLGVKPDLTTRHWVDILYRFVQAQCQLDDRPPKDLILDAVADLADVHRAIQSTLENLEAEHVQKALLKMAEPEGAP